MNYPIKDANPIQDVFNYGHNQDGTDPPSENKEDRVSIKPNRNYYLINNRTIEVKDNSDCSLDNISKDYPSEKNIGRTSEAN